MLVMDEASCPVFLAFKQNVADFPALAPDPLLYRFGEFIPFRS